MTGRTCCQPQTTPYNVRRHLYPISVYSRISYPRRTRQCLLPIPLVCRTHEIPSQHRPPSFHNPALPSRTGLRRRTWPPSCLRTRMALSYRVYARDLVSLRWSISVTWFVLGTTANGRMGGNDKVGVSRGTMILSADSQDRLFSHPLSLRAVWGQTALDGDLTSLCLSIRPTRRISLNGRVMYSVVSSPFSMELC